MMVIIVTFIQVPYLQLSQYNSFCDKKAIALIYGCPNFR